jgi:hypothetical protein
MLSPVLTALERIIQADRQIPGVRPFRVNRVGLRFGPHFRSSPHHFDVPTVTSGLLSETDIVTDGRHVSNVPIADSCTAATGGSIDHLVVAREHSSFGQPRFAETLNDQLRV